MESEAQSLGKTLLDGIQENAGTAIAIGIFLLIAGVLALGAPFATGISITLMIGGFSQGNRAAHFTWRFKTWRTTRLPENRDHRGGDGGFLCSP